MYEWPATLHTQRPRSASLRYTLRNEYSECVCVCYDDRSFLDMCGLRKRYIRAEVDLADQQSTWFNHTHTQFSSSVVYFVFIILKVSALNPHPQFTYTYSVRIQILTITKKLFSVIEQIFYNIQIINFPDFVFTSTRQRRAKHCGIFHAYIVSANKVTVHFKSNFIFTFIGICPSRIKFRIYQSECGSNVLTVLIRYYFAKLQWERDVYLVQQYNLWTMN